MATIASEERYRAEHVRQEKWDRRFLELAKLVSTWSKDPSTQVGAVLVKKMSNGKYSVVGIGFNGFPPGVQDAPPRLNNREVKYKFIAHAEVNAIVDAGRDAEGATLYVYPTFAAPPMCSDCCKTAIVAQVAGIVGYEPDETDPRVARWKESIAASAEMWSETGKFCRLIKERQ